MATTDRGFASMDKSKQRDIARQGGIAAHKKGVAHEYNSATARAAAAKSPHVIASRARRAAAVPATL